jgi:predicted ATP-grasp superfamily ATP-dependent carboligase
MKLPPVVMLGGEANALSVARRLARAGVQVYGIGRSNSPLRWSRCCTWVDAPDDDGSGEAWSAFLLGSAAQFLAGSVLLTGCDVGLELMAKHRDALARRFILDASDPDAQIRLLNKLTTYQAAVAADVPTPRFWVVDSRSEIAARADELVFPLLVKPRYSHTFASRVGKDKFAVANDIDEVFDAFRSIHDDAGVDVLLMESIPGPDDRLCSYYTYIDEAGRPLFHFTKRVIRRFPENRGPASYHVTDWSPEVMELSLRLFRHVGIRGLVNAEFKRDARDGRLKLIECNCRFTAANALVAASGLDLARFVYNRLVGLPPVPVQTYATGLRLWDPVMDFRAFLELRRKGRLTTWQWLASLMHSKTLPYFEWADPLPSLATTARRLAHAATAAASGTTARLANRPRRRAAMPSASE